MNLAPILEPAKRRPGPRPANVDLRKVFLIGTAVWVLMLGLVTVLLHVFHTRIWTFSFLTCIIGIGIGLCLLVWEHWYRPEYTKLSADGGDEEQPPSSSAHPDLSRNGQ